VKPQITSILTILALLTSASLLANEPIHILIKVQPTGLTNILNYLKSTKLLFYLTTKNLGYFTKNKPTFFQNKKIATFALVGMG
jgi:hypothetical protein